MFSELKKIYLETIDKVNFKKKNWRFGRLRHILRSRKLQYIRPPDFISAYFFDNVYIYSSTFPPTSARSLIDIFLN